jgi:NAD(P)-dependent dehydrogenase (short-subunit alcohol dehydrogenase family)
MKLDGKVALITGAASGIGHQIARRFVEAGGRVVIADLNLDAAKAAAKELGGAKDAIAVAMDVRTRSRSTPESKRPSRRSARSTFSSPMPASRSCIRSRIFPTPTGRRSWRSTLTARF